MIKLSKTFELKKELVVGIGKGGESEKTFYPENTVYIATPTDIKPISVKYESCEQRDWWYADILKNIKNNLTNL